MNYLKMVEIIQMAVQLKVHSSSHINIQIIRLFKSCTKKDMRFQYIQFHIIQERNIGQMVQANQWAKGKKLTIYIIISH